MQGGSRVRVHGVHHLPTPKKAFFFVFAFTRFLSGAPPPFRNPGSPPPLIWLVTDSEILFFLEYTTDYMLSNFKIIGWKKDQRYAKIR